MKLVAFSGSFRKHSINSGLLRALQQVAAENVDIEIIDYADVPLYNQDINDLQMPQAVQAIATRIADADAVIIASPEYNYSVPGVLKNLLDWLSRVDDKPLLHKAIGIVGASPSMNGTIRAQMHLRQILQYFDARVLNKPELSINYSAKKFDEQGDLVDADSLRYLKRFLDALVQLADS